MGDDWWFLEGFLDPESRLNWGFDPQKFEVGVYGEGEAAPDVRITAINGILNSRTDCLYVMEVLSSAHGGVNIHYVYWNSEGWTADMFKCLYAKMGYLSKPAAELAKLWQSLIAEMGGVEGPGQIIHFAHSIGATETLLASRLLSREELSKLHIVALGGASIIPPDGLGSVINYISKRDGVALMDPVNLYKAIRGEYPHVSFIGDFDAYEAEHTLYSGNYPKIIEHHGNLFKESFLR